MGVKRLLLQHSNNWKIIHQDTKILAGADPGIFERGGPEAIIYKILERGGPKSLKMAFECSFQSLSYKSFANIPQKVGAQAPWAPPLNPPLIGFIYERQNHVLGFTR